MADKHKTQGAPRETADAIIIGEGKAVGEKLITVQLSQDVPAMPNIPDAPQGSAAGNSGEGAGGDGPAASSDSA